MIRPSTLTRLRFVIGVVVLLWGAIEAPLSSAISPEDLTRKLTEASWPPASAAKVASVQSVILTQAELSNPAFAIERLQKLRSLGRFPPVTRLMLSHPQLAGLVMYDENPLQVAEILSDLVDRPEVLNTLMTYAGDSAEVIRVIGKHRKALLSLPRDGDSIHDIPISLFLNTSERDSTYRKFVEEVLLWTGGSSERRAAVVGSLNRCSDNVRRMFAATPDQTHVAAKAWMDFCNAHPDHGEWMCGAYFEIDQLIRFFRISHSREMAERVGIEGPLLFVVTELSPELSTKLPRVIMVCDNDMLDAITNLRNQLGIVELVSRSSLSTTTMKAALLAAERNTQLLSKWIKMTDGAIAREVGTADIGVLKHVPFVEVTVKLVDGQELTVFDGAMIAVDTASIVFPFVKGGAAGLRSAGAVLKDDVIAIAKVYGDDIAEKAYKMTAKELQQKLPDVYEAAAKKAMTDRLKEGGLDITGMTRLAFQQVGKRSKTFKKFTGLDSKVFMRSDRVIVIYPHETVVGQLLREVIESQSAELAIDRSGDTIIRAKEKVEHATQQLNAIWIACNEPNGFGEMIAKTTESNQP